MHRNHTCLTWKCRVVGIHVHPRTARPHYVVGLFKQSRTISTIGRPLARWWGSRGRGGGGTGIWGCWTGPWRWWWCFLFESNFREIQICRKCWFLEVGWLLGLSLVLSDYILDLISEYIAMLSPIVLLFIKKWYELLLWVNDCICLTILGIW